MKKIFAIALAVVMVLSIASVASAFTWSKPAEQNAETFASRYQIDVVKLVNQTGIIGTNSMIADDNATAVNNAPVYFYIRLTINDNNTDDIKTEAEVKVDFTALNSWGGNMALPGTGGWKSLGASPSGTYYYDIQKEWFYPITDANLNLNEWNSVFANAVIEARCLDTETAKVTAQVRSQRDLTKSFEVGDYTVQVGTANNVYFAKDGVAVANFFRNPDGKVIRVDYGADDNETMKLYEFLDAGNATEFRKAVDAGEVYMTNDNLWAAFGFNYKVSDTATWKANSTPIILDPTVSIPKTGDNASVIGFAMIMVAVVAAAVAVRKVNA